MGMRAFFKLFSNAVLNTMKGNREGINVFIHSWIPSVAPDNAFPGNRINMDIASIKSIVLIVFLLCATRTTSCGIYMSLVKEIIQMT